MNLKSILVLIFIPIYMALCWKYYVCHIKYLCSDEMITSDVKASEPIQFYKNSDSYILGDFKTYADSILKLSSSQNLDIVGQYLADEHNTTDFDNLGLARAHALKELLVQHGLDSNKLNTIGVQSTIRYQDSLARATSIEIAATLDMQSKDVQIVNRQGMTEIYFPTNSKDQIKSKHLDSFLAQLVLSNQTKTIQLIGHTDNVGQEAPNQELSLKRTNTIRDLLIYHGMPSTQIDCIGKGSKVPKVQNTTPENRALNRRVEIIVL